MASSTPGVVMIAGSALFFLGAAIAVPRVFTELDRHERLRMLEERPALWRLGQPLYAVGALVAALGVGTLAADGPERSRAWLVASCGLLVVGALAWSWSAYVRARRPREFALGELPGWPFAVYVWFTLAGLLLLGVGLLLGDWPGWAGWLTLGAGVLFLAGYVRFGDIPPFVFYVVLTVVGVAVL